MLCLIVRHTPPLRGTPLREGMARQRFLDNTLTIYVMRQPIPSRRGVAEGRGVSHRQTIKLCFGSHRQTGRNRGVSHRQTIKLCFVSYRQTGRNLGVSHSQTIELCLLSYCRTGKNQGIPHRLLKKVPLYASFLGVFMP